MRILCSLETLRRKDHSRRSFPCWLIKTLPDSFVAPEAEKRYCRNFKSVNVQDTSAEPTPDLQLEIAHLLLIDVVGYSKLLVNEQIEVLQKLNQSFAQRNVFALRKQATNLFECQRATGWRYFFFAARKSRCDALWTLAKHCRFHRSYKYGRGFTAARLIGSPMSTTKRT